MELIDVFAANLKAIRKSAGMTQADLAATIGVSLSFLTDLECAKKAPSFQTLEKLSYALETPAWFFLCEKGNAASSGEARRNALAFRLKEQITGVIDDIFRAERG